MLLVGGGDSAFDWAVNLQGVAESIMLIHRRDGFRAHAATINQVQELCRQGRCDLRTFWEVKKIEGNGKVERVTIFNNKTKEEETLELDAIIPLLGFHSDLGAIKEWGLDTEKADIKVNQLMETNVPGIYAAGDITAYPGKLKLIATGAVGGVHRGEQRGALHQSQGEGKPGALLEPGDLRAEGGLRRTDRTSSSRHLRPHEEPQLPRSGQRPLHLDPHHAALGIVDPQPSRRIGEQQRGQLLDPGRMAHQRHDRRPAPGSPMSSARRTRSGSVASAAAGNRRHTKAELLRPGSRPSARRGSTGLVSTLAGTRSSLPSAPLTLRWVFRPLSVSGRSRSSGQRSGSRSPAWAWRMRRRSISSRC